MTESNGQVIGSSNGEYITDENGRIVIEGLEPGLTITVKEIKTLEGYILDTTPKSIKIKVGAAQTLRFYNQKQGNSTGKSWAPTPPTVLALFPCPKRKRAGIR